MSTTKNVGFKRSLKRKSSRKDLRLTKRQRQDVSMIVHRNQELKFIGGLRNNTAYSSTPFVSGADFDVAISVPSTAAAFPLAGTTDITRIGDRIRWAGTMEIRMYATNNGATNAFANIRYIVFQWHPSSNPAGSGLDILLAGPTGAADYLSTYNHDNRQQYTILVDQLFTMNGNTAAATNPMTSNTTIYRSLKVNLNKKPIYGSPFQHDVQYSNQTLTGTNRLYILVMSDSAAANKPTLSTAVKTFFRDS